jgi:hypothetical protein
MKDISKTKIDLTMKSEATMNITGEMSQDGADKAGYIKNIASVILWSCVGLSMVIIALTTAVIGAIKLTG